MKKSSSTQSLVFLCKYYGMVEVRRLTTWSLEDYWFGISTSAYPHIIDAIKEDLLLSDDWRIRWRCFK